MEDMRIAACCMAPDVAEVSGLGNGVATELLVLTTPTQVVANAGVAD